MFCVQMLLKTKKIKEWSFKECLFSEILRNGSIPIMNWQAMSISFSDIFVLMTNEIEQNLQWYTCRCKGKWIKFNEIQLY